MFGTARKEVVYMPAPTVVLVHGAFADASSLRALYDDLVGEDVAIIAPPNPLRGLSGGDGDDPSSGRATR